MNVIDGDYILIEGIDLIYAPGHSQGTQAVSINTKKGKAIISGFCCTTKNFILPKQNNKNNIEGKNELLGTQCQVITPGIHINTLDAFDSANKIMDLADILIPQHDSMFMKIKKIPSVL